MSNFCDGAFSGEGGGEGVVKKDGFLAVLSC